ncbi:hypothetical protein NDU88_004338 [Pleurodeles waltl]|uniref:Late embryogenesis abundant protein LEA-2 subgroup domain-containing protein n=1 Tax=Pleurodeles waltl TaxID=8319 RepID=A0AAV7QFU2_PLEWA|nr:hypothetical protein NDU88_004338 [Pleurodeles waltl]
MEGCGGGGKQGYNICKKQNVKKNAQRPGRDQTAGLDGGHNGRTGEEEKEENGEIFIISVSSEEEKGGCRFPQKETCFQNVFFSTPSPPPFSLTSCFDVKIFPVAVERFGTILFTFQTRINIDGAPALSLFDVKIGGRTHLNDENLHGTIGTLSIDVTIPLITVNDPTVNIEISPFDIKVTTLDVYAWYPLNGEET